MATLPTSSCRGGDGGQARDMLRQAPSLAHAQPLPFVQPVRHKGAEKLGFLPFKQALRFVRTLNLKTQKEWKEWCRSGSRPINIPSNPHTAYKADGWQGCGHWLGTGKVNKHLFLPFKSALAFARALGLKSTKEWENWRKSAARPSNIPLSPQNVYRDDGWEGYGHWLGTGNAHTKEFMPFHDALDFARSLNLTHQKEWETWRKSGDRPANIPSNPDRAYTQEGWQGYSHWLGYGVSHHTLQIKVAQHLDSRCGLLSMRPRQVPYHEPTVSIPPVTDVGS